MSRTQRTDEDASPVPVGQPIATVRPSDEAVEASHQRVIDAAGDDPTSLRRRLRRALQTGTVLLALATLAVATSLTMLTVRQDDVTEVYYAALTQGDLGLNDIENARTALLAYVATGDPTTLVPFERLGDDSRRPQELRGIDTEVLLRERFGDRHPALAPRAEALAAAQTWYFERSLPLIEVVDEGGPEAVTDEQLVGEAAAFEELQVEAAEYLTTLRAERDSARDEMSQWRIALTVLLGLLVLAAIALGVLLWTLLRRWVTDPLAVLAADARHVADGEVDHVVTADGPGEVGQVARDVEAMRLRLSGLVAEANEARAELEQSHGLLQEQAEDLRRSNRDLEQFAYVASHDLQEPLRKIASFTQLLQKRYGGQLDDRADQYIGFAVDGAKRMQRLINDLLSFSRVGRIGGEIADVDMARVLDRVRDDLGTLVEETGAQVVGEDLPTVRGEAPLLTQLVQNLVGNAVKFRHPDRAPVVTLSAWLEGECWEFACADNGIGIDEQYADRVFVIFQRLHAKDVYEGTGIGLALCKKIVEYHGGHIWIDTSATEGTTIRWRLPADPDIAPSSLDALVAGAPETVAPDGRKDD